MLVSNLINKAAQTTVAQNINSFFQKNSYLAAVTDLFKARVVYVVALGISGIKLQEKLGLRFQSCRIPADAADVAQAPADADASLVSRLRSKVSLRSPINTREESWGKLASRSFASLAALGLVGGALAVAVRKY